MIAAWPFERLGEALEALARRAGVTPRQDDPPHPPGTLSPELYTQWIEAASGWLGLETEAVELLYGDLDRHIRTAGPALFALPNRTFAVLLEDGRLLAPDLSTHRIDRTTLHSGIAQDAEASLETEIAGLLASAGIPRRRYSKVRTAITRELLRDTRLGVFWTIRMPPGASAWPIVRRANLPWRIAALTCSHAAEYLLWIGSWWLVGLGALQGRFDPGWLIAWALLLLTMVPLRAVTVWLQGVTALVGGGLLKERLLFGALRLDSDYVRRKGAGQLLGSVMESEALESLALSGGFLALMALVEIAVATIVLAAGAGGLMHSATLACWVGVTMLLAWRYYRKNRHWTAERLQLTHDLVERMDGHRTRLAQEPVEHWHDGEDRALERYLAAARTMDNSGALLAALVPRGWLIIGLLGLAPAFISGSGSPVQLAIGAGGMLLAWRALLGLTTGLWNLAGAAIAWKLVTPFFQAASQPERHGTPDLIVRRPTGTIIDAQDLFFRYEKRNEAVIRGCNLRIRTGDHFVLDGHSGSGKSTFGSLIAGLREPDSGLLLAGGLDRRTLGFDQWRRVIACAPQFHENHVICGPFAWNLLMGRPGPLTGKDVEEAEAVCRELGLGDLLGRMPAGMLQMVGETGWQLSHGERSRLFMARALLQGAEAILLDESLAALDPENLRLALQCIAKRAPAALVIAHR